MKVSISRRGILKPVLSMFAVLLTIPFSASVYAQEQSVANGFRISPVRSELTINKGDESKMIVTIENPTDIATNARAVVNDFVASEDENGSPRLILDEGAELPKNDFSSLVQDIGLVPLGPREKKDIEVVISVPEDASSGGYYGAIRFLPVIDGQESNVGLTASVGTIVLVTVPGDLTESASIVQISALQNGEAKGFFTSGDIGVLTRIQNTGDIHIKPFGRVEVKNMFGKSVASFDLNNEDTQVNILPDSIRRFENQLDSQNWFGRYTIEANLGLSQGSGNLLNATASFWYIPTWAIFTLIGLVVLLAVGIYVLIRKSKGKSRR